MKADKVVIEARILNVSEGTISVQLRYFSVNNHYPIIDYQYTYQGATYVGRCAKESSRKYRVPEINGWGDPQPSSAFFWRQLKTGDIVPVLVNVRNPEISSLAIKPTHTYLSERKAIWIGAALVCLSIAGIVSLRLLQ